MSINTCRWCGKQYDENKVPLSLGWDKLYYCSMRCKMQYEKNRGQSASKDETDSIVDGLKWIGILILAGVILFVGYAIWYGIQYLWNLIF